MKLLELSIIILSVDSTALSKRVLTEFDSQICNFVSFGSHLLSLPTSKSKKKSLFIYIFSIFPFTIPKMIQICQKGLVSNNRSKRDFESNVR